MVDIVRYIDTDVVGGLGDGTSWANAYSSMQTWVAAEATVVASGDRHLAYFRGTTQDVATVTIDFAASGWSGSGELHLIGDSPDNPTGLDVTKYRFKSRNENNPFRVNTSTLKIVLKNLQREFTGSANQVGIYASSGAVLCNLDQLHCVDNWQGNVNSTRYAIRCADTDTTTATITKADSLTVGSIIRDINAPYNSGLTYSVSRSTYDEVTSFLTVVAATSSLTYTDCAIPGAFTASSGQSVTFANCATEAGLGANPVTVVSWSNEFIDYTNDDFTLDGNSQLIDSGSTGNNIGVDQATVPSLTLSADSITAGTIRAGDTVTIQLSNATNASGKTLSIPQGSITPSAQDINSISFIAPDLKTFGDKTGDYSTNITITVTDGAESDTIDFQVAPDVGDEVGAITALEGIYAEPEFSSVAISDLYYTATIADADFTVGAVPVLSTEQTFNLWIQDQTGGAWGDPFVVTIPASGSSESVGIIAFVRDIVSDISTDIVQDLEA